MGIFGALQTAVAGLRSQSYAMENISGNVANSQTVGYKRMDTSFVDLVIDSPREQAIAGSVRAQSAQAISLQGDILPTGKNTNIAINGSGFISVSQISGFRDGQPVFSENNLFTRRGDFQLDKDGYLVNGAGMYLRGDSINLEGLITSTNGILRITDTTVPASASEQVEYSAVLPSTAGTNYYNANNIDTIADNAATGAPFNAGTWPNIQANESSNFLSRTISGGSVVVYNEAGAPIDLQLRWGKLADDEWALFYQNDASATGATPMWTRLGAAPVEFQTNGTLDPGSPSSYTIATGTTVNGQALSEPLNINFGTEGLRQFAVPNNLIQGLELSQDGYPAGVLQDISISSDGRISGIYSNGQSFAIARVAVAQFAAPNMLKPRDGGTFEQTIDSGQPTFSPEGARIIGGAVEQSNADIAEEFSKMIVTQQAYQANTRVVTTSQQLMEATINMVR
ncbi:flagellar hook-basal body complex protein [Saliniramus sp.]|uniref:flagellar hook protein FlgE n=1 Tax=Saliniramus sp. TaxID=2986772 RepID=UPI002D00DDF2|nr:flagellar hook-basal body complex protein [Saliniramus sp.]HMB10458.1 flagellar hook-basal body complex protein [Saliniramus sp.]